MKRTGGFSRATLKTAWVTDVDPAAFVVSLNVHRRHLTTEQKRQAIADHIKAGPTASDREIGRKVGADNKTVAKVRADLEARGEIPHVSTRTDSAGRKQPAAKPKPIPKPTATAKPAPIDEDTVAEQAITTEPPGGLTENSPGQTDRVKQALENAKAATGAIEPARDDSASGPAPDDSDTGPDFGIVLSGIAAALDELSVYVTALDTDAKLTVVEEHIDAINDVAKKMQQMLRALKAAQKKRPAGISERGNCTGMAAGRDGGDVP